MTLMQYDKNRKWQKRTFYTRDKAVYHAKDKKVRILCMPWPFIANSCMQCKEEALFCYLTNHEVYTLTVARQKSPSDFVFAFKSQESIKIFEKPERDYIHFVCVDNVVQMREWLIALRTAKVSSIGIDT